RRAAADRRCGLRLVSRGRHQRLSRRARRDAAWHSPGDQIALRDVDVAEGARDAPPRPVDADAADARPRAAPDPPPAGAPGAAASVSGRAILTPGAVLPARAEAQQQTRLVQGAEGSLRNT